jgi:hypothetical protein
VLNNLQAEFGTAPAAEESERQNAAQLLFLNCVTVSCPSLRTFYKRLAERGGEVFWMGD